MTKIKISFQTSTLAETFVEELAEYGQLCRLDTNEVVCRASKSVLLVLADMEVDSDTLVRIEVLD